MHSHLLTKEIVNFLQNEEFINIATCDFKGRPNVAPKFLLKIDKGCIFLVDYVLATTYQNLKINPRASLSVVNIDTLIGYQINGKAQICESGKEFDVYLQEMQKKKMDFSINRIIEGMQKQKKHGSFEINLPDKIAVLKIRVEEVVEIGASGKLDRKFIEKDGK